MSRLAAGPEFDFIRAVLEHARGTHPLVRVGPGDDCAIVGEIAISTDASVDGVHFRRDWLTPEEIGWRAVAAALSDLAAVAAEPIGVLVSLIMPARDRAEYGRVVMQSVVAAAETNGAVILGGDTTAGDVLTVDVVAVGRVEHPVLRAGARPGDELWTTGRLGGSAAAVAAWQSGTPPSPAARERYARPRPRIREALWLHDHVSLTAMIDFSDGLLGDVAHVAAASNCRIIVDAANIPIDEAAGATYEQAVSGGEDYELCFTAGAGEVDAIKAEFGRAMQIDLTRIGTIETGSGVWQRAPDGIVMQAEARGFQHFKDTRT